MPLRDRTLRTLALAAALAAASVAVAQAPATEWNPRTGDAWVDERLGDINRYGERYRESFIDELARYHGAPRDLVRNLLAERRWAPGDVYYACSMARIIGRPCGYVVEAWDRDRGEGWGAVAQRLGVKPGSDEFHRLKRGFVPTYDRWQRPITLDRDLADDFPERGKRPVDGKAKGADPAKGAGKAKGNGKAKDR